MALICGSLKNPAFVLSFHDIFPFREYSAELMELAEALEFMPLALAQAAAYIQQRAPRCSVQQYLNAYRRSDKEKTSLLNQEAGRLRRDQEATNSI